MPKSSEPGHWHSRHLRVRSKQDEPAEAAGSFLDEMLRSDEKLRVEEIVMPAGNFSLKAGNTLAAMATPDARRQFERTLGACT